MNLRYLAFWTLALCTVLGLAYLGYDGVRGSRTASRAGERTVATLDGDCDQAGRAVSPMVEVPSVWAADVTLDGDFRAVHVVKLRLPTGHPNALAGKPIKDFAEQTTAVWSAGQPAAFTFEIAGAGVYVLVFTGKGKWTARVRY